VAAQVIIDQVITDYGLRDGFGEIVAASPFRHPPFVAVVALLLALLIVCLRRRRPQNDSAANQCDADDEERDTQSSHERPPKTRYAFYPILRRPHGLRWVSPRWGPQEGTCGQADLGPDWQSARSKPPAQKT
jgi:hypothetical protein